jgi:hypothetical protein
MSLGITEIGGGGTGKVGGMKETGLLPHQYNEQEHSFASLCAVGALAYGQTTSESKNSLLFVVPRLSGTAVQLAHYMPFLFFPANCYLSKLIEIAWKIVI